MSVLVRVVQNCQLQLQLTVLLILQICFSHFVLLLQLKLTEGMLLDRDVYKYLLVWLLTENEVDGMTLTKLTESMVSQLLPTMKMQVQFLEAQKTFLSVSSNTQASGSVYAADTATASVDADVAADIRPSPIAQNG